MTFMFTYQLANSTIVHYQIFKIIYGLVRQCLYTTRQLTGTLSTYFENFD